MNTEEGLKKSFFERFASKATIATGNTTAIIIAFGLVFIWALCGPFFSLFRSLANGYKHRNHYYNFPHGIPYSESAE